MAKNYTVVEIVQMGYTVFGNFSDRPCPVSTGLKYPLLDFKKSYALGFYEFLAMLEQGVNSISNA